MTNSHNTTVALPLLPAFMQPRYGSNNDILMPQLFMPFSLVPSYQSTDLLAVMPFEPLVLVPSPGASQGLAGQLYCRLSVLLCCALGAMWEPCL
jgi:hypothetical protein